MKMYRDPLNFIRTFIALTLLSIASYTTASEWQLDKSHSSIGFAIDHLVISETTGKFEDYAVNVTADEADFKDVKFSVSIKTDSINTSDVKRDEHLKSEEFFDVKKYPTITFEGKQFIKQKNGIYKVYGTLDMHGVKKELILNGKFGGIIKDPWGGTRTGLKITGTIDRYDFGLKYNSLLESGGLAIGRDVRITANVEFLKK